MLLRAADRETRRCQFDRVIKKRGESFGALPVLARIAERKPPAIDDGCRR